MVLRDNRGSAAIPATRLAPGASVVVACARARLPEGVPVVRLPGMIGNGLANGGDRLALLAADRREIDVVAYGDLMDEDGDPIPAPGSGESIERRFTPEGQLVEVAILARPTPGHATAPGAGARSTGTLLVTPIALGPAAASASPSDGPGAWIVLLAIAGGALGGAGAQRLGALLGRAAPPGP